MLTHPLGIPLAPKSLARVGVRGAEQPAIVSNVRTRESSRYTCCGDSQKNQRTIYQVASRYWKLQGEGRSLSDLRIELNLAVVELNNLEYRS
jgi:hypothetical protein